MNTPSPPSRKAGHEKDGSQPVRFGSRQVSLPAVFLFLATVTAIILFALTTLAPPPDPAGQFAAPPQPTTALQDAQLKGHAATDQLVDRLKEYGLWAPDPCPEVPRLFINSYPADMRAVQDIGVKKKVFLHSLLPHALFVRREALKKRERLKRLLYKVDCPLENIHFTAGTFEDSGCAWSSNLAEEDVGFIRDLSARYRTGSAEELLQRVDAVPTSIILAQGAIESSWGSSRFTREGNSVFGMWTWKKKGIVPARRDEGKTHKVKVYGNIRESVRAYHLTLNRVEFYDRFRQLRKLTNDPLVLAEGLSPYSERGNDYVEDIRAVITSNALQQYDDCRLSDFTLQEFTDFIGKEQAKTSL